MSHYKGMIKNLVSKYCVLRRNLSSRTKTPSSQELQFLLLLSRFLPPLLELFSEFKYAPRFFRPIYIFVIIKLLLLLQMMS